MSVNKANIQKYVFLSALLVILLVVPIITHEEYTLHIFIITFIAVMLTSGLHLPFIAGMWDMGQAAFYAIGAYTSALIMINYGVPFWLSLPIAGIVAIVISLGLGYLFMRAKGIYFMILTLALVEIVRQTIIKVPFLGGYRVTNIPPPNAIVIPHVFQLEFISKVPFYYLILAFMLFTIIVLYRIDRSRVGTILRSVAINEGLCRSVGIDTTKYKVLSFVIGSFFAGIAGALYASYAGIIGPTNFDMWRSIMIYIPLIIGGAGSLWGAVLGAAFLTILPEVLRPIFLYEPMIYGAVLILVLFFLPGGFISLPRVIRSKIAKLRIN
jgi:branched-chain amino acid transport system permease protein